MAWQDELRPASWRGVPFFVEAHRHEGGRRVAVSEFPGRRKAQTDDLGSASRRFAVEAYLLGPDCLTRAERLQEALDQPGPGVLVVPWGGPRRCQVMSWSRGDSQADAGMVRISIGLMETETGLDLALTDPGAQARGAADELTKAAKKGLLARVLELGVPEFVRQAIGNGALKVVEAIGAVPILTSADSGLDLTLALQGLAGPAADGSLGAELAADSLIEAMPLIGPVFGKGRRSLLVYERVIRAERPPREAQGAMGQAAETNETALINFAALAAAGEAVSLAATIDWESYDEAAYWRAQLEALLSGLEEETEDQAFGALRGLRAALAGAVPPPNRRLPRVATWTPPEAVPAEVVAYQVFGSAAAGLDIARRNRLKRPLAAPATPLEILVP